MQPESAPKKVVFLLAAALACGGDGPTAPAGPAPVAAIQFDVSSVALYVGDVRSLVVSLTDAGGAKLHGRLIMWASSDPEVATVSEAGILTALKPGTASVTVAAEGKFASLPVSVSLVPVRQLAIVMSGTSMYVGGTVTATAVTRDSVGGELRGRPVAWSTSNPAVISMTGDGVVRAVAPGTADVVAEAEGVRATASVTVALVPVASVAISPATSALYVGGTVDLTAGASDSAGNTLTGRSITWSSANASVATVSSTGVVNALVPGSTIITATVEGKTAAATITVSLVPVATVAVSPSSSNLYVGQTVDLAATAQDSAGNALTGRAITWSSGNTSIATVSSTGLVTALTAGSATITATVEGKTGSAGVTIAQVPVAAVTLSAGDSALYPTVTLDYDAFASDSAGNSLSGRPVTWSSSNAVVATVSAAGVVTALAQGQATITAVVEGKTAAATVTVRHDPVIFVHGFASSPSVWSTMTTRLAADGWRAGDLASWSYNSLQSNVTTASAFRTTVDSLLAATGARRVDIVTHSMGGLPSRYYLKNLDGAAKVDAWVSLGGPNHGTETATQCAGVYVSCAEMQIGSAFLTALNSGDETPGAVRYGTWWSACDTTINPDESVALAGATNTQTACLSHSALYSDLAVYGEVKAWIK